MKIDKNLIKELSEYLNEFNLTEIEFTEKDTKIKVSKNNISINNQTIPVTQKPSNITDSSVLICGDNAISLFRNCECRQLAPLAITCSDELTVNSPKL